MEFEEKTEVTEETVAEEFNEAEATQTEEISEETVSSESEETEDTTVTEVLSEDTEVTPSEEQFEAESEEKTEETENAGEESFEESTESESEEKSEDDLESAGLEDNCLKMSVNVNGEIKTFEVSLRDKMNALYELVNSTYSEADNDYYDVDVFEDSKTVVMHGWFTGKHFRQQYQVKKEVYSLKGDRVEVFAQFLTSDEIAQLDTMKGNYSVIESELAQYKSEPEKMSVLESEDYANLAGNEAFETLKAQENHFELSVEEVKAQCDAMLLEYAKGHKVEFEAKEEEAPKKTVGFKRVIPESPNKKSGKYGGIFSRNK